MAKDFILFTNDAIRNAHTVKISQQKRNEIDKLAKDIANAKLTEEHHQNDHGHEIKRQTTGLLGEAALEELLNIKIINWEVGDSKKYHKPDIPGTKVGIKTVEYGKFPIIFKNNYYSQIICVISKNDPNTVHICGLATPDVLNSHQDDSLVLSPYLLQRGTKTAFFGFDKLIPVPSYDVLKTLK